MQLAPEFSGSSTKSICNKKDILVPNEADISPATIEKLSDACNELCVALETYRLARGLKHENFAWERLLQRKKEAWELLDEFGY